MPGSVVHEPSRVFQPRPDGLAERLGRDLRTHRPIVGGAAVVCAGYIVMAALLIGLGLIVTKLLSGGPVGTWEDSAIRWFVAHRTPAIDTSSSVTSALGTFWTVTGIAVAVSIVLAFGRHWREVGFLAAGLILETTVALTTSLVINRPRPNVSRLDVAPPTSSFPSGHTAAAMVLYVSLALVLASFVRNAAIRVLTWAVAVVIPILVGISRLYRGMHHPTDVMGSVVLGAGCLIFALLATRTACAIADRRAGEAGTDISSPTDVEVHP
jgi:membrane-associated phospholipid phosphatase